MYRERKTSMVELIPNGTRVKVSGYGAGIVFTYRPDTRLYIVVFSDYSTEYFGRSQLTVTE